MALSTNSALNKDRRAKVPAMQHRHFAFIAKVINEMEPGPNRIMVATAFTNALRESNPNFDANRFLFACCAE